MPVAVATTDLFKDASKWRLEDGTPTIIRGVPVFDEHTERDERRWTKDENGEDVPNREFGKVTRVFDAKKLQQIADNCNRRFQRTGDAAPLTIGHTRPGRPETEQPPIIGYAINFRLGRFGPEGVLAILADFYILPQHWRAFLEHPRRSVEFFPRDEVFDPIALLVRTPERDLGVIQHYMREQDTRTALRYAFKAWQTGQPCLTYCMKCEGDHMGATAIGAKHTTDGEGLEPHLKEGKKNYEKEPDKVPEPKTDKLKIHYGPDDVDHPEHPAHLGDDEDKDLPPEHAYAAERYHKHLMRHPVYGPALRYMYHKWATEHASPETGQEATHKVGEGAMPVHQPAEPGEKKMEGPNPGAGTGVPTPGATHQEGEKKDHFGRSESAIQYAREVAALRQEIQSLRQDNATLMAERNMSRAEAHVLELEGMGYDFGKERGQEVERFSKMSEAQCVERKSEIQKHWTPSGAPVGGTLPFPAVEPSMTNLVPPRRRGEPEQFSREMRDEAMALVARDPEYIKDPRQNWEGAWQRALEAIKKKTAAS